MEIGDAVHDFWGSSLSIEEYIKQRPEQIKLILQGVRSRTTLFTSHNLLTDARVEELKRRNQKIRQLYSGMKAMYRGDRIGGASEKGILEDLGRMYGLEPLTIKGIIEHSSSAEGR